MYLSSLSPNPDAQPIISPGMKILQLHATRNDDKLSAGYPLLWRVSQQHYIDWSKVTGYPRYTKMSKRCNATALCIAEAIINEVMINYCMYRTWTLKLQGNHIMFYDTVIMWCIRALWISFIVMYCLAGNNPLQFLFSINP